MTLQPTQVEYKGKDTSGAEFEVVAHMTPDRAWAATVTLRTAENAESPDAAVRALKMSAESFLLSLEEIEP